MHEKFTLIQKHDLDASSYFTSRALEIMFKFKIYKSVHVRIFFSFFFVVNIAGVANLHFTRERLF